MAKSLQTIIRLHSRADAYQAASDHLYALAAEQECPVDKEEYASVAGRLYKFALNLTKKATEE